MKSALQHLQDLGLSRAFFKLRKPHLHSACVQLATTLHRGEEHIILRIGVVSPPSEEPPFYSPLQLLNTLLELTQFPQ